MPCIRKIVRASFAEDQNAVIALLQLDEEPRAGDVPVAQQLSRGFKADAL